jgi:hypothetical protein
MGTSYGLITTDTLTWLVAALVFGLPTTLIGAAKPFSSALSVAALALFVYENAAWHLPGVRAWIAQTPDLRGVWRVEIQSTFVDPNTGQTKGPIKGFAQIDQAASKFCMRIYTKESQSKSVAHAFKIDHGVFQLALVYENKPNIRRRDERKSAHHQGSSSWSGRGYYPHTFKGEYWTERKNIGTIVVSGRRGGAIDSYEEGRLMFDE